MAGSKTASEVPAGSESPNWTPTGVAAGECPATSDSKPAKVPTGSRTGSRSLSARWEGKISAKLEAGFQLSAFIRTWWRRSSLRPVMIR